MNAMRAHASLMRGQGRVSAGDVATDASTAPAHSVTRCDGSKRSCCTSDAPELLRGMSEAKLVAVTFPAPVAGGTQSRSRIARELRKSKDIAS